MTPRPSPYCLAGLGFYFLRKWQQSRGHQRHNFRLVDGLLRLVCFSHFQLLHVLLDLCVCVLSFVAAWTCFFSSLIQALLTSLILSPFFACCFLLNKPSHLPLTDNLLYVCPPFFCLNIEPDPDTIYFLHVGSIGARCCPYPTNTVSHRGKSENSLSFHTFVPSMVAVDGFRQFTCLIFSVGCSWWLDSVCMLHENHGAALESFVINFIFNLPILTRTSRVWTLCTHQFFKCFLSSNWISCFCCYFLWGRGTFSSPCACRFHFWAERFKSSNKWTSM